MNIPDLGEILELEVLSKPEVVSATIFKIQSQSRVCSAGQCCSRGRVIPCQAIYPHENGLVVEREKHFLLNNAETISGTTFLLDEIQFDRTTRTILGWTIPQRIFRAYKHPWGAMMIEEMGPEGLALSLLVLPH